MKLLKEYRKFIGKYDECKADTDENASQMWFRT